MLKEKELILTIAKDINNIGGKVYFVGGYVRDLLLGKDSKDIDVEIHGITPQELKAILSNYGEVDEVGASFGILMIKGYDIDFSMPRTERKIGEGHKGFNVDIDPFMGVVKACKRRDFTINSLIQDVITGEIIDSFNGINDLNKSIIAHVDNNSFIEDPLRVFRACQFASRFNFNINQDSMKLCSQIDISSLPKERVLKELEKAILKSKKPSLFFIKLKEMNHLKPFFNELEALNDIMFDYVMGLIDKLENKTMENVLSVICYYILDKEVFLSRFTNEINLIKNIHHNINILTMLSSDLDIITMRKIAYASLNKEFVIKDLVSAITSKEFFLNFDKIFNMAIEDVKVPLITSKDLFDKGYKPGKDFGDKLKLSMEYQFNGYSKSEILAVI